MKKFLFVLSLLFLSSFSYADNGCARFKQYMNKNFDEDFYTSSKYILDRLAITASKSRNFARELLKNSENTDSDLGYLISQNTKILEAASEALKITPTNGEVIPWFENPYVWFSATLDILKEDEDFNSVKMQEHINLLPTYINLYVLKDGSTYGYYVNKIFKTSMNSMNSSSKNFPQDIYDLTTQIINLVKRDENKFENSNFDSIRDQFVAYSKKVCR